jgi:putative addiction module killer protein
MLIIRKTGAFADWLKKLRDRKAVACILVRVDRLGLGNAGDVKPVGEGVSEMRIDYGPGYRVYFVQRGKQLIILLCGGDKNSQFADISKAKVLAKELNNES